MAATAALAQKPRSSTSFGRAAVVTGPRLGVSSPNVQADLSGISLGELRRQEAARAEEDFRRTVGDEASRSAPAMQSFVRPAAGAVTGPYGERRRRQRHPGIDFDGTTGDPVVAASAGTVVHSGQAPDGYSGYGLMVLIDHGGGVQTLYAHFSSVWVGVGTRVQPGDPIGAIGTTGFVTGSHLHFEVRIAGAIVDPTPWLA